MYKTVLNDGIIHTTFAENLSLDEVRASFLNDLRDRGFTIDTPVQSWKVVDVKDDIQFMEFVAERYRIFDADMNTYTASIHKHSV